MIEGEEEGGKSKSEKPNAIPSVSPCAASRPRCFAMSPLLSSVSFVIFWIVIASVCVPLFPAMFRMTGWKKASTVRLPTVNRSRRR